MATTWPDSPTASPVILASIALAAPSDDIDDDLEAQGHERHLAGEHGRGLVGAKFLKVLAPRDAAGEAVRVLHDRERRLPIDVDGDLPSRL